MTATFGEITRRGETFDLDFERVYATTVQDVWEAVTDRDRLARWMERYDGDLRLGGRWSVRSSAGEVLCDGTVTECEPPHRYVTTWQWAGEQATTITITVREHPEGAVLRLQHAGLVNTEYGAGWQTYLEQLDDEMPLAPAAVTDPGRAHGVAWDDRFGALEPVWSERLGGLPARFGD